MIERWLPKWSSSFARGSQLFVLLLFIIIIIPLFMNVFNACSALKYASLRFMLFAALFAAPGHQRNQVPHSNAAPAHSAISADANGAEHDSLTPSFVL